MMWTDVGGLLVTWTRVVTSGPELLPRVMSVSGPTAAGVCVDIHDLCYHQGLGEAEGLDHLLRPTRVLRVILQPQSYRSEWPACTGTRCRGDFQAWAANGAVSESVALL